MAMAAYNHNLFEVSRDQVSNQPILEWRIMWSKMPYMLLNTCTKPSSKLVIIGCHLRMDGQLVISINYNITISFTD